MLRHQPMDRGMDAKRRSLDFALAGQDAAVISHFHEAAGGDLGPMQAERNLIIAVVAGGNRQRQMVENAFVEAVLDGEPVRRGKIDPGLPAQGFGFEIIVSECHQAHIGPVYNVLRRSLHGLQSAP